MQQNWHLRTDENWGLCLRRYFLHGIRHRGGVTGRFFWWFPYGILGVLGQDLVLLCKCSKDLPVYFEDFLSKHGNFSHYFCLLMDQSYDILRGFCTLFCCRNRQRPFLCKFALTFPDL